MASDEQGPEEQLEESAFFAVLSDEDMQVIADQVYGLSMALKGTVAAWNPRAAESLDFTSDAAHIYAAALGGAFQASRDAYRFERIGDLT